MTGVEVSFTQSVTGITNCLSEGISVNSISTVSSYNQNQIEDLVLLLKGLGLKRAAFNMCSSQPSGYEPGDQGLVGLRDYARIVEDIGLRYDFVRFYAILPLCLFDQEKLIQLLELRRMRVACSLLAHTVAIDPGGNILPCTHMPDISYGNLDDPGIMEQLQARKDAEIAFLKTHAPSEKCVDCRLWNTCLGGCSLIWFSRKAEDYIVGLPKDA